MRLPFIPSDIPPGNLASCSFTALPAFLVLPMPKAASLPSSLQLPARLPGISGSTLHHRAAQRRGATSKLSYGTDCALNE